MLQQSNDAQYEVAHLIARLAGEEGPDHPRQKAVRWLEASGASAQDIAGFNQRFSCHPDRDRAVGNAIFDATCGAVSVETAFKILRAAP